LRWSERVWLQPFGTPSETILPFVGSIAILSEARMQDFEKLGSFYLGREHDLAQGQTKSSRVLYDSKDLTTHAVCVGMTGSGKTGLCLSLLEEAALDGLPAIAIDPKGDLGNLLLTFPELQAADFRPWIDPSSAARKGITPDQLAQDTASLWRNGLAEWDQDGDRIRRFREAVDLAVYTPGSSAGIPLTVLKSFNAPAPEVIQDGDALRDRIQSAASGVLALLGIDADPVRSREHILLSNVLDSAWRNGRNLDLPGLIQEIQNPPFKKVGVVDLDSFFPASSRLELGMQLNNLLASPSFASWMEGEPLDVQRLFYTDTGKPRLSILSIAHLDDAERMFFVTILLSEVVSWMRSQPGTSSLRALLYMDEVFGFFPPTANPPSKRPMLTLLKQARAYGLGCVLATQNPVDLDYKGLSNAGTWFLGRLQTERDKARVLEGLEGASAQAGARFDRGQMEATLAALGSRVFLLNNVHDDQPTVFHTRWAMSYLCGPLTRDQIRNLMKDRKSALAANRQAEDSRKSDSAAEQEDHISHAVSTPSTAASRPIVSASIEQRFWPVSDDLPVGEVVYYRPGILGGGKLHFVRSSYSVDHWSDCVVLQPVHGELPALMWDSALVFETASPLDEQPQLQAEYGPLPSELAREKNYSKWKKELKDYLYRTERCIIWHSDDLDEYSQPGETEPEVRIRLTQQVREKRDEKQEILRQRYAKRIQRATDAVSKAQQHLSLQKTQFWTRVLGTLTALVETIVRMLSGSRSGRRVSSSTASQTMREHGEKTRAQQRLDDKKAKLEALQENLKEEQRLVDLKIDPSRIELDKLELPPRKSDTVVDQVVLVWLPWRRDSQGSLQPAY